MMIEEDLDAELTRRAADEGVSKAALIRSLVRKELRPLPPLSADPVRRMAGADEFESTSIDDEVYR